MMMEPVDGAVGSEGEGPPSPMLEEGGGAEANLPAGPSGTATLGYNLEYPGEWSSAPPFIDQMKSTPLFYGECDGGEPCDENAHLDLDPAGWPRSMAFRDDPTRRYDRIQRVLMTTNFRSDIGERFVITWEGNGDFDLGEFSEFEGDRSTRRLTFLLPEGTIYLRLFDFDPADPLRNIRVYREDYEAALQDGDIFNPELLEYLAPFRGLRFMDWALSNVPGQCSGGENHGADCYRDAFGDCGAGTCVTPGIWQERPTLDRSSWISWGQYIDPAAPALGSRQGGYPIELMILLANRVGKDAHFNIPTAYTDEYLRNYAEMVRDGLAESLTATFEYSNEAWNWGFPQTEYGRVQGELVMPGNETGYLQYVAGRTDDMCRVIKEVFAGQEQRVRCVISPQTSWTTLADTWLQCPDLVAAQPERENCYRYVDAININGYFSGCLPDRTEEVLEWLSGGEAVAVDMAFEQLLHGGLLSNCDEDNLDQTIANYTFYRDAAEARGLGLYIYESGTHFEYTSQREDFDPAVQQLLVKVTQDPRMHEAYLRNFRGFSAAGGSMMNVWGWVADELWSNVVSLTDWEHPKYQAIRDFMQEQQQ